MRMAIFTLALCVSGCANRGPWTVHDQAALEAIAAESQRAQNAGNANMLRALGSTPQATPAMQPQGVTAVWTGRNTVTSSVTGAPGFNCEYAFGGRTFWRMFVSGCPSSIQVY